MDNAERTALGDVFDRKIRNMTGAPDCCCTKATTVRAVSKVLELSQTFIVQTYRQREEGDTVFIEYIGKEGSMRLPLPPEVTEVIARQRDALTTMARKRHAKAAALDRKARGIKPAFARNN